MVMKCKPSCRSIQNKEVDTKDSNTFYTEGCVENVREIAASYHQTYVVKGECKACCGLYCENKGNKGFEYIKCKEFRKMTS